MIVQYIFLLIFTLLIYAGSLWLYNRFKISFLHPLITSAAVIIVLLSLFDVQYEKYEKSTEIISFMLAPSVVALGWALYKQIELLKVHYASILISVVVGSLVGILSVLGIMRLLGASLQVEMSIVPKSVTTPIAILITERAGGITSLTAVVVIITGVLGSLVAPVLLRRLGVSDAIARGLAIGSSAHGLGTARAMELGAVEGAISGLAIGLVGVATTLLVPLVYMFF